MKLSAAERLRGLGGDVDFLLWLEGDREWLPRIRRICDVNAAHYAAAVRGAVWLTSQFAHPDRIGPDSPDQWRERYQDLERFLINALRQSMACRTLRHHEDLEALEDVLEILLPEQTVERYRRDIRELRKLGKPDRSEDLDIKPRDQRRQRTGGRRQPERVDRLRAALEHLRSITRAPYRDLAELWNEHLGEEKYIADRMRQLLRKGPQTGPQLLAFWRGVHDGDFRHVFPGDFPGDLTERR